MRFTRCFALVGALALAACGPHTAGPPATPSTTAPSPGPDGYQPQMPTTFDTVEVTGTQGLIVAELAYNTAATGVKTAVQVGLVKPGSPLAVTIRGLNRTASDALEVARGARTKVERAAAVARALGAIASLSTATPKAGAR